MKVHFSAPYPVFGRPTARLSLSYQQRSPYYWWWAYLRRNQTYLACCEKGGMGKLSALYADFGDVREDNFHKWWTEGQRGPKLFGEQPLSTKFMEITSPDQWRPEWTSDKVMVVTFPLAKSKRKLMGDIKRLLDQRHPGKQGRPGLADLDSTARYRLTRNYTIHSLRTALDVYDRWHKSETGPANERLTLWEIGEELSLNHAAAARARGGLALDRVRGRNYLSNLVKRYLTDATRNVEAVAQGHFPAAKARGDRPSVKKNDT